MDITFVVKELQKGPQPIEYLRDKFGEEEVWLLIDGGIIEVTIDFLAKLK